MATNLQSTAASVVSPPPPLEDPNKKPATTDPILKAIEALSQQFGSMSLKPNAIETKMDTMVSKQDLQVMQTQMGNKTQVLVSSTVDPLKDKTSDLHARLGKVEQKGPRSPNQNAGNSTDGQEI